MSDPVLPKDIEPENQEQDYVHEVYNEIAAHFSSTRFKPWPVVQQFLLSQPDYSIGLDVGCGNGKYLGVNDKLFIIGTDRSEGLIECAHGLSKKYNVGIADGLNLPHEDNKFDFAISVAVIHHFSTEERRIEAITHILSKLKKSGKALIYCWALEQEHSRRGYKEGDDQDVLVPWVLQDKSKKNKDSDGNIIDKSVTKYRYYHLYKKGELMDNAKRAGDCTVVDNGYERDNWWIVIQKN